MIIRLTYDYPLVFIILPIVPVIFILYQSLYTYRKSRLSKFADIAVLKTVLTERSIPVFFCKSLSLCLAIALIILALANPKGNPHHADENLSAEQVRRKPHEVILLIDASASMGVPDTHSKESRLDYAKEIADQLVSQLKGETVSLYAFTSALTQLSPETTDYFFIRMMINRIQINEGDVAGTDFTHVLLELKDKYLNKITDKLKTVVIISDGGDTQIEGTPANVKSITDLIESARENKMVIYTVGTGSKEGGEVPGVTFEGKPVKSTLESTILKALAAVGKGRYFNEEISSPYAIAKSIATEIEREPVGTEKNETTRKNEVFYLYDYYFRYPLGMAIFLLIFVLFFPDCTQREGR